MNNVMSEKEKNSMSLMTSSTYKDFCDDDDCKMRDCVIPFIADMQFYHVSIYGGLYDLEILKGVEVVAKLQLAICYRSEYARQLNDKVGDNCYSLFMKNKYGQKEGASLEQIKDSIQELAPNILGHFGNPINFLGNLPIFDFDQNKYINRYIKQGGSNKEGQLIKSSYFGGFNDIPFRNIAFIIPDEYVEQGKDKQILTYLEDIDIMKHIKNNVTVGFYINSRSASINMMFEGKIPEGITTPESIKKMQEQGTIKYLDLFHEPDDVIHLSQPFDGLGMFELSYPYMEYFTNQGKQYMLYCHTGNVRMFSGKPGSHMKYIEVNFNDTGISNFFDEDFDPHNPIYSMVNFMRSHIDIETDNTGEAEHLLNIFEKWASGDGGLFNPLIISAESISNKDFEYKATEQMIGYESTPNYDSAEHSAYLATIINKTEKFRIYHVR